MNSFGATWFGIELKDIPRRFSRGQWKEMNHWIRLTARNFRHAPNRRAVDKEIHSMAKDSIHFFGLYNNPLDIYAE
jgi:hypothetical protein